MKYLLSIIIILFFSCNEKNISRENDSSTESKIISPFRIVLFSGDESIQKYEIDIYEESNEFYAKNISPCFYYGNKTDSIWKVKLSKSKILQCKKFLETAKSMKKNCRNNSSSITEYVIYSKNDSIKIYGDCDWKNLDFFQLRKSLFEEEFEKLEQKRLNLISELNNRLLGKWYYSVPKTELERDSYIILTRESKENSKCFWEIKKDYNFKDSCNNIFDFKKSNEYKLDIDEGKIFFEIQTGFIEEKGITKVENNGATFIIDKLNDKELKLQFLWR